MPLPSPTAQTRLVGADLRTVDLSGLRLSGVDLRRADLRGVTLDGRDLRGSDLRGASLDGASLREAKLDDCDLDGASLNGADLSRASLRRTGGFGVKAEGLVAEGANLNGAEWREAVLVGAELGGVRGREWRLDRARLAGAKMRRARLEGAVFDEADLDETDLVGAHLVRAAFLGATGNANLAEADLRGADLRVRRPLGLLLTGAKIERARMSPALAGALGIESNDWAKVRRRAAPIVVAVGAVVGTSVERARVAWAEWRARPEEEEQEAPEAPAPAPEPEEPHPAGPTLWERTANLRSRVRELVSEPEEVAPARPSEIGDDPGVVFPRLALLREQEVIAQGRRLERAALAKLAKQTGARLDEEARKVRAERLARLSARVSAGRKAWKARLDALRAAAAEARARESAEAPDTLVPTEVVPVSDVSFLELALGLEAGNRASWARVRPWLRTWRWQVGRASRRLPGPLLAMDRSIRRLSSRTGRLARLPGRDTVPVRAIVAVGGWVCLRPFAALIGLVQPPKNWIRRGRLRASPRIVAAPRVARQVARRKVAPTVAIGPMLRRTTNELRASVQRGLAELRTPPGVEAETAKSEERIEFERDDRARRRRLAQSRWSAEVRARREGLAAGEAARRRLEHHEALVRRWSAQHDAATMKLDIATRVRALAPVAERRAALEAELARATSAERRAAAALMALETERARAARLAERNRAAAQAELERLEAAAREAEERAVLVAQALRAAPAEPIEEGEAPSQRMVDELLERAAERRADVVEQLERVRNAQGALASALRSRVDSQGRALATALREGVSRGVGRIVEAATRAPIQAGPGADLSGQALDGGNLSGQDLRGAIFAGCRLSRADMRDADLRKADLRGADLTGALLDGARLGGALLDGAIFDEAEVEGTDFAGASVTGARFVGVKGMAQEVRRSLQSRGADTGVEEEWRWARTSEFAVGLSATAVLAIYLVGRFASRESLDAAALEQAAAEAQRLGNSAEAAQSFATLAAQADDLDQRINYLLEAAAAGEEAGDIAGALEFLEKAAAAANGTGAEPRVLLTLAQARVRAGLNERAAAELRALLSRTDLSPEQRASAVVALWAALPEGEKGDARAAADLQIDNAATDPERSALAMALADSFAGLEDKESARAVLDRALAVTKDETELVTLRLRVARLRADSDDSDGALAAYAALYGSAGDAEARLGAAELYSRRGMDDDAIALLTPLLESEKLDRKSRASLALANIAERRNEDERAVALLRAVLEMEGLEARLLDEARIALARLDPAAADALVAEHPELANELRLGRARSLREEGDRDAARALWEQVATDPSGDEEAIIEAQLSLADLEVEEGVYAEAVERYDKVLASTTSASLRQRVALGKGNALVRSGKLQEAEATFSALLGHSGGDVADQCRLGLARAAEMRGQADKAGRLYEEVGRGDGPWAVEALVSLGRMKEATGDIQGAIAVYRTARARPGGEATRRTAIDIALAQALDTIDDPEAATVYQGLLDARDPVVRVQAKVAVGERSLGTDPVAAKALFEAALAEAAEGAERNMARAGWLRAAISTGGAADALTRLDGWLDEEGDAAERGALAVEAVRALAAEGQLDSALTVATRWRDDGGFELAMEAAGVLRGLGRPAEAVPWLSAVTGGSAEDERWRREMLASAQQEAGDAAAAASTWATLEGLEGGAEVARLGQARALREQGEYTAALKKLDGIEAPRASLERAEVLMAMGRVDEAEAAWRRITAAPDLELRTAAHVGLARLRLEGDDPVGALAALSGMDVVDPGYTLTVAQVRAEALLTLGRVAAAEEVYRGLDGDAESRVVGALGLAQCALAKDEAGAAKERFGAVLGATSDRYYQARAMVGVVQALLDLGDRDGAMAAFDKLAAGWPERTDALDEARTLIAQQ